MVYNVKPKWWGNQWKANSDSFISVFIAGTRDHGSGEPEKKAMGALTHGLSISLKPWAGSLWLFILFCFGMRGKERKRRY